MKLSIFPVWLEKRLFMPPFPQIEVFGEYPPQNGERYQGNPQ